MSQPARRYTRARNVFAILFVLSAAVFCVTASVLPLSGMSPAAPPPSGEPGETNLVLLGAIAGAATSCVTALATLVGLISTTVLGWRGERRAVQSADLERRRQELALERERLEVERLRADAERRARDGQP